jgi:hypothetical protein
MTFLHILPPLDSWAMGFFTDEARQAEFDFENLQKC